MREDAAPIFQNAPWIEKPSRLDQLTTTLASLVKKAGPAVPLTPAAS
jgi:hypothetical protein